MNRGQIGNFCCPVFRIWPPLTSLQCSGRGEVYCPLPTLSTASARQISPHLPHQTRPPIGRLARQRKTAAMLSPPASHAGQSGPAERDSSLLVSARLPGILKPNQPYCGPFFRSHNSAKVAATTAAIVAAGCDLVPHLYRHRVVDGCAAAASPTQIKNSRES